MRSGSQEDVGLLQRLFCAYTCHNQRKYMFIYLMRDRVLSIWADGIRETRSNSVDHILFTGFYVSIFNNADGASLPSHKNALCH